MRQLLISLIVFLFTLSVTSSSRAQQAGQPSKPLSLDALTARARQRVNGTSRVQLAAPASDTQTLGYANSARDFTVD